MVHFHSGPSTLTQVSARETHLAWGLKAAWEHHCQPRPAVLHLTEHLDTQLSKTVMNHPTRKMTTLRTVRLFLHVQCSAPLRNSRAQDKTRRKQQQNGYKNGVIKMANKHILGCAKYVYRHIYTYKYKHTYIYIHIPCSACFDVTTLKSIFKCFEK